MRPAILLTSLFLAATLSAQLPARRALIVAIDDYSASQTKTAEHRGWPELRGAVRDAETLRVMLRSLYGFAERDILVLENRAATRAAILRGIEQHLVRPAKKGDVLFFYFAGHGSQVPNSLSDEIDKLDESIVPADSRLGVPDIRDKELRRAFNAILARGAALTLVLDHCHSGSSFRGLPTGARPRGILPSRIDVKDGTNYGPRPETRGALVLAATQDLDAAWEIRGDDGQMHGTFSWALIRAMRDALPGQSAEETFSRAAARMRIDRADQHPVLAGLAAVRNRPLLGDRRDRPVERRVVAIERVETNGIVIVQGGWIHGLTIGSALRGIDDRAVRLTITKAGLASSEARSDDTRTIRPGMLVELTGWAAPPARPMRVWAPPNALPAEEIARFGKRLATETRQRKIRWISDPLRTTPTHVIRFSANRWELLTGSGAGTPDLTRIPAGAKLFVQLPAPFDAIGNLAGIERVPAAADADYILAGRLMKDRIEYAWLRPQATATDRSGLPQRSEWIHRNAAVHLRESLARLRRIHAWHHLDSPPGAAYRLALQRDAGNRIVDNGRLIGKESYRLVLTTPDAAKLRPRYYYAFTIDSHGRSYLIYPRAVSGSVENRFPFPSATRTLSPGESSRFQILPPYGIDTYFLLSTDQPLLNPAILEWDGVRAPQWTAPLTPLEELLIATSDPTRGRRTITTGGWSLEKVSFESVPPKR
ncbi:MAG TPA: caspase family protein [Thermoanaerobaculia bacterium]|nr:caspase family protein [Thermoanaerobaculia bacterium]